MVVPKIDYLNRNPKNNAHGCIFECNFQLPSLGRLYFQSRSVFVEIDL